PRLLHPVPGDDGGARARVHAARPVRPDPVMNGRGFALLMVLVVALVAVPLIVTNEFYLNLASQILIYALLAVSLNLLVGYGGLVSLGHASFLGLTSYAATLFLVWGSGQLGAAVLAVAFSTLCGALFGVLALRASGI